MREGTFIEPIEEPLEGGGIRIRMPYEIPWPTVGLDSEEFGHIPFHERFRQLAIGYLASAKSLTVELGENPDRLNWPRASAACFCFYHAVELFVKACILIRSPTDKVAHHDVTELKIRYHELYPHDKFFAFPCPWDWRVKDVEQAFGVEASGYYFDGKDDQLYRYMADKLGKPPIGITIYYPGNWLRMMERFEEDMERIWENVLEVVAG